MERPGSTHIDELVRRAMIGDGAAFTELWDTYVSSLKAYIRSTVRFLDEFYVDDICSKSFQKAFQQIRTYDPGMGHFYTWLRTIAHNTAMDTVQYVTRTYRSYVSLDENMDVPMAEIIRDEVDTPLDSIIKDEDEETLEKCIAGLPELYRDVARRRLVEGMPYKEIAEETGLELNTVRTRIRRSRQLIDKMKEDDL